jgi:hypothetical protein
MRNFFWRKKKKWKCVNVNLWACECESMHGRVCMWLSISECMWACVSICDGDLVVNVCVNMILLMSFWASVGIVKYCVGDGLHSCLWLSERTPWMDSGNTLLSLCVPAPQGPSLTEMWAPPGVLQADVCVGMSSAWLLAGGSLRAGAWASGFLHVDCTLNAKHTKTWHQLVPFPFHTLLELPLGKSIHSLTIQLAIKLLSMHLTDLKSCVHSENCTRMFVITASEWSSEALFGFTSHWGNSCWCYWNTWKLLWSFLPTVRGVRAVLLILQG